MKSVKVLLMLALAFLIATPFVSADDKVPGQAKKAQAKKDGAKKDGAKKAEKGAAKKRKKPAAGKGKGKGRQAGPTAAVTRALKQVDLTQEQKDSVEKLVAEYSPKFKEIQAKRTAVLSPELLKKRQEATKKAREEGKKGKEIQAAVNAAVSLTEEQKTTIKEVGKAQRELTVKFRAAVLELLNPEQAEKSGLKAAPKRVRGAKQPPKNDPLSESADAGADAKAKPRKKAGKGGAKKDPESESAKKDTAKKDTAK